MADLLLTACALAGGNARLGDSRWLPQGADAWRRLAESAEFHQLRPALVDFLAALPPADPAEREARERLEAEVAAHRGRGLLLAAELAGVLRALRDAGVRAMPFKGPAFAALVGSGPGAREMNDLDLLIEAGDIARAIEALEAHGYVPTLPPQALASRWLPRATNELALGRPGAPLLLELHWLVAPAWHAVPVTVTEVLARAVEREFHGSTIEWPAPDDLFLIHVADGVKSGGSSLRWMGDLAAILRSHSCIDWARAEETAGRNGGLDAVRVALAVLEDASNEAARSLAFPQLAPELPTRARALAAQARRSRRLASAVAAVRKRQADGSVIAGGARHFGWALATADRRLEVAARMTSFLAGPSVGDLEHMPAEGLGNWKLRWSAVRRRLRRRTAPKPA